MRRQGAPGDAKTCQDTPEPLETPRDAKRRQATPGYAQTMSTTSGVIYSVSYLWRVQCTCKQTRKRKRTRRVNVYKHTNENVIEHPNTLVNETKDLNEHVMVNEHADKYVSEPGLTKNA